MSAFTSGSFNPIRGIPEDIKHTTVSAARSQKMEANRTGAVAKSSTGGKKKDVFKGFEYICSRYTLADELRSKEREESEAKRKAVSGKDFVCSDTRSKLPFEDAFGAKDFRYPHITQDYDGYAERMRRTKWIEDSKILHGPFVPSGVSKPLVKPDRSVLEYVLRNIHSRIESDWGDFKFAVLNTEDDRIVVRFELASVDSERGLHAYMNVFAETGDVATQYSLTRVTEDWHSKPGDGFLYYMFRPPWAHARPTVS